MPKELLQEGHTRDVIKQNAQILQREGRGRGEARAIAHRKARSSLRTRLESGVEVFRAGNYPGKVNITEGHLDTTVQNYNELQAPRGHRYQAAAKQTHNPDMPALGWVSALSRSGRSLYAKFRDTTNELLDGIIEERYPNPSVQFRPNLEVEGASHGLSLKAIGFMGADPPAVKDVAAFNEDPDSIIFSYQEWNQGGTMPDENKPNELTINVVPGQPAAPVTPAVVPAPAPEATQFSEADVLEREKQAATKATEEAKLKFAEEQATKDQKRHEAENLAFAEQMVKDGKLKPANRDYTVAMLNGISPDLKFSEGEGDKAVEKSVLAETKAKLGAGDVSSLFSEVTPSGEAGLPIENDDPEGIGRDKLIKEYAAKHELSYGEASEITCGGYEFPAIPPGKS